MPATLVKSSWISGGLVFDGEKLPDAIPAVFFYGNIGAHKNDLGVAAYCETHVDGALSGHTYGFGSWINLDTGAVGGGNILAAQDNGGKFRGEPRWPEPYGCRAERFERCVFFGREPAGRTDKAGDHPGLSARVQYLGNRNSLGVGHDQCP